MIKIRQAVVFCAFIFFHSFLFAQNTNAYFLSGIPDQGHTGSNPYVTAGDRSYMIGNQDGSFPDMGGHVKGEMGGLWIPPVKIIDGFWARVTDLSSGETAWLDKADRFINYPFGNSMEYSSAPGNVAITRFQFCPDGREGIVVDYQFKNNSAQKKKLSLELAVKTDISPVWFSNKQGIFDSPDAVEWDAQQSLFKARDSLNSWFAVWGATEKAEKTIGAPDLELPETTRGRGVAAASVYQIILPANGTKTIRFVFAGSRQSMGKAVATAAYLRKNAASLLSQKKQRYRAMLAQGRISIPDKHLQEVYDWVKINTDWLVRTVPEIGTGLTAGYMEYAWWFGADNTYALQAVMATGNWELVRQSLRLLKNVSQKTNGNGRIVHEITTNGGVYHKGNLQETAHFIMCVAKFYQYTGDTAFVREMYPYLEKGIHWLLVEKDQNKNLFPEGYGIMEIEGLNAELIDVAVYTQQALESIALLAKVMGDDAAQARYRQLAQALKDKINRDFWDGEKDSYCDFYGTTQQAAAVCRTALKRMDKSGKTDSATLKSHLYFRQLAEKIGSLPEQDKGWLTYKNWVISTPMETGIAPREKAIRALDLVRKENCGPFGPYLSAASRRHMMTISTGVQAVAECRYGRMDEALWYIDRIAATFNRTLPGSISEMMPDYGCFTQAWTNYGIVVPLVEYMFGIQPDALQRRILIVPQFPRGWDSVSIGDLPVGDDVLSYSREKSGHSVKYVFTRKKGHWDLFFNPDHETGRQYYLNGRLLPGKPTSIPLPGKRNELVIKE